MCPTGALKPKREWLLEAGNEPSEIMRMTRSERRKKRRRQERPYQVVSSTQEERDDDKR